MDVRQHTWDGASSSAQGCIPINLSLGIELKRSHAVNDIYLQAQLKCSAQLASQSIISFYQKILLIQALLGNNTLATTPVFILLPATMTTNISSFVSNMQAPSLDASDLMSIGDHLGGKKIDNAIESARYAGIPEQGEQTGGYVANYAYLSHIPLFPLYSPAQLDALAKIQERKERKLSFVPPPQKVSTQDKIAMAAMSHLSGGANPLSVKKWERRLQGVGAITAQRSMQQTHTLMFTRWAIPGSKEVWFVDVLEWRGAGKLAGAQVYLKTGKMASVKTLGDLIKDRKANKTWTKRFMNRDCCEAVSFVGGDKSEVPMEIVARVSNFRGGVLPFHGI